MSARRSLLAIGGRLTAAFLGATLLGYVFLLIVARSLDPDDYGAFLGVWGLVFGFGSATSVVEQETARVSAQAAVRSEQPDGRAFRIVVLAWGAQILALAVLAATGVLNRLASEDPVVVLVTVLAILLFVPQFAVRGWLTGSRRIDLFSGVISIEALARLSVLVTCVSLTVLTPRWAVLALGVGSLAFVIALRPSLEALRPGPTGSSFLSIGRKMLILAAAAGLSASLLAGYPAILTAVVGSSTGLGAFFAAVTAARIPLVALAPVQSVALPELVRVLSSHDNDAIRRHVRIGLLTLLGVTAVGVGVGFFAGPLLVQTMFGGEYVVTPRVVAALIGSTVLIGGTQLGCSALLSAYRHGQVLGVWGAGAAAMVVAILATPGDAVLRGTTGLVAGSLCACLALTVALFAGSLTADASRAS